MVIHWERLIVPLLSMGLIIASAQVAYLSGWRINLTESEPLGIYQLEPVHGKVNRGALVEFCPPVFVTPERFPFYMRGTCPGGGMPMFKTVAGIPGDRVRVNMDGVWINGQRLRFSQQVAGSIKFPKVRLPHQQGDFVLGKDEYWIYGSGASPGLAAQSFDSRYWGTVTRSMIYGSAV
ncbi:S26 family signal peptidase [Ferrovum myxofaciens]|uniref:S26 family signal peptidase n=1 Tax=Ferrovum myxofaciens TaxID=416213 RepID=UPI0006913C13|nr:S26 family signal peptidase [Ferrovum myxofaciens]